MDRQSFVKIVGTTLTWFGALGFITWGFVKSWVYWTNINDIQELQTRIYGATERISAHMLQQVFRATVERW